MALSYRKTFAQRSVRFETGPEVWGMSFLSSQLLQLFSVTF